MLRRCLEKEEASHAQGVSTDTFRSNEPASPGSPEPLLQTKGIQKSGLNPKAAPYTPKSHNSVNLASGNAYKPMVRTASHNDLRDELAESITGYRKHIITKTSDEDYSTASWSTMSVEKNKKASKKQPILTPAAEQTTTPNISSVARIITNTIGSLKLHARKVTGAEDIANPDLDDLVSQSTRAEHWSTSSYHTTSQGLPEDEELPPAQFSLDFDLPLESLLKPIKKSTYQPITQQTVQEFLANATWEEPGVSPPVEPQWTSRVVPSNPVNSKRHASDSDKFLEGLVQVGQGHVQCSEPTADVGRRSRLERYPGREIVYEHYAKDVTPSYTEHFYVKVKRIRTQSSNPPFWYLNRLRQGSAPIEEAQVPPKTKVRP